MTWNLWWRFGPWLEREAAIQAVVEAEQPDVLCLQEVWSDGTDSIAARLGSRLGYEVAITEDPFAGAPGREFGFHNAILSRASLTEIASHPLPNADGSPGHRRALTAAIETRTGRWPILCTHLAYRFDESGLRQLQCATILELVASLRGDPESSPPAIVCGDFNAVPDSDEIRLLTGRRAGPIPNLVLSDTWEQVGDGVGHTWRRGNPYQPGSAWPNRRLDYVFVSWPRPKPLGNPVKASLVGLDPIVGVVPSDHAALVVELDEG